MIKIRSDLCGGGHLAGLPGEDLCFQLFWPGGRVLPIPASTNCPRVQKNVGGAASAMLTERDRKGASLLLEPYTRLVKGSAKVLLG